MNKEKETNKKLTSDDEEMNDPASVGKKAIEADKKVSHESNNPSQQEANEKKDAEQWRNEG